jgi:hypothetical protein
MYDTLASKESIERTKDNLAKNGFLPIEAATGSEALEKIKELIPAGASVLNGSSTTLNQIGYIDYLKSGSHPWKNNNEAILAETDKARQAALRKQLTVSDFYLGSVHALSEDGQLLIASNTGSQMPSIVFNSQNIIFVVSTKKIVKDLSDGLRRIDIHVVPLEDDRMMKAANAHTLHAKTLVLHKENPMMGRKVYVLLVSEDLGF